MYLGVRHDSSLHGRYALLSSAVAEKNVLRGVPYGCAWMVPLNWAHIGMDTYTLICSALEVELAP